MTAGTTSNDLAGVLAQTRSVLLDFDGPVCPIFADGRNAAIASVMRDRLRRHNVDIPAEIEAAWDPLHVLWFVYRRGPANLTAVVDDTFVEAEVNAALTAQPTPHAHDAIRACHEVGRPVVVVSNNAAAAIEAYLNRHQLAGDITAVVGRTHGRPDLMKPHPDPVNRALRILRATPDSCVLVGDSVTDIEVAHKTGVRSIGYVKAPDRLASLLDARPDAVTDSMADLATAIRASRPGARAAS